MARVRPFRAFTYPRADADITAVTAPPYDVISPAQREELLRCDPHNVVALELPEGPLDPEVPGNCYETGAARWKAWREEGILVQDDEPTLYVIEQHYELDGVPISRRAFIAEVGLEPFDAGVVLPHERTLPKALGDRLNLTRACAANFSQVFGLYSDAAGETDEIFERIMSKVPIANAIDADDVETIVWTVDNPAATATLTAALADKRIFIADGHHRYTTALAYRDERRAADAEAGVTPTDPAYDWVMMALVNMDDPSLVVLPTHRVADAPGDFNAHEFYSALAVNFDVTELGDDEAHGALNNLERPGFLIKDRDSAVARLAVLRQDVDLDAAITKDHAMSWKELDVAVLLELVLDPLLNIHPDRPETLDRLSFVKNAHDAMKATEEHDVAFILRPTRMDQLRAVALAGDMMPQKSTYFYPKMLSGVVLRSME
ncbi:MAG: DUF1015 domain-containing protein [Actinomycetota bacterium]|nr:DUF1015 domain-containing protein [Actinomycetota bacterium]